MLTVWGRANSSNVKKVLWCLEALNVPYQRIDAGGQFGKLTDADYLALNPNGAIPVINDHGFILWESNAIMRYLAQQYGGESLYPQQPQPRAVIDQWLDWMASSLFVPFRLVLISLMRTPVEQRDPVALAAGIEANKKLWGMANDRLASSTYLAGEHFSLADIALLCYAYGWFNIPLERPSMPHLERWYSEISAQPLFKKLIVLPLV